MSLGEKKYIYIGVVDQERGRASRGLASKPARPLRGVTRSESHGDSGLELSHPRVPDLDGADQAPRGRNSRGMRGVGRLGKRPRLKTSRKKKTKKREKGSPEQREPLPPFLRRLIFREFPLLGLRITNPSTGGGDLNSSLAEPDAGLEGVGFPPRGRAGPLGAWGLCASGLGAGRA